MHEVYFLVVHIYKMTDIHNVAPNFPFILKCGTHLKLMKVHNISSWVISSFYVINSLCYIGVIVQFVPNFA